jgi:hypothetical protein
MYLPVAAYCTVAVYVGVTHGHVAGAVVIGLWQIAMCVLGGQYMQGILNSTWKAPLWELPNVKVNYPRWLSVFLLRHSVDRMLLTFGGVKVFSLLMLQFLVALNDGHASRENVCFVTLFIISAHCLVPLHYVRFTETELAFLRNLPIPLFRRFFPYLVTYTVIFLPEFLFLIVNERAQLGWPWLLAIYGLFVARMGFFTSLQYLQWLNMERYTLLVMGLFLLTFMILASVSLLPFIVFELVLSWVIFSVFYYRYQHVAAVPE